MGGKVKYYQLTETEKKVCLGDFYTMVSMLEGRDEVKKFFKDLLSLSETVMISRRIQVAKKLMKGLSYDDIIREMRVGKATVAQVDRWLNSGFGGYRQQIKKYNNKKTGKIKEYVVDQFSLDGLRKKYPAHFLLFNIFKKEE